MQSGEASITAQLIADHERRIAQLERIVATLCEQVSELMSDQPAYQDLMGNQIPSRDVSQTTL